MSLACWYYEKKELKNTPSVQDGIDAATECRYRQEGARFIVSTGTKMDLGYNTMATGVVYFHRFYMFHSFREFPRYVTACCCLFLAGKVEETPKKCKDIIRTARSLLTDAKFATFGENPREEVMTLERILLQTIKFDLQVEHPYQYLLKYAKCLKGDKAKLQKMVQMAWTFVNDSLCTTLSLQWEPEVIAVALMYLAGKLSKFDVVDWMGRSAKHLFWWDMFVEDVTMNLLEDICHQVLDLYSSPQQPNQPDSPPLPRKNTKKDAIPHLVSPATLAQKPLPPLSQLKPSPMKMDKMDDTGAPGSVPPPVFVTAPPPLPMPPVPPVPPTAHPPPPFMSNTVVPPPPFPPPFAPFPLNAAFSRPPGYYPPPPN